MCNRVFNFEAGTASDKKFCTKYSVFEKILSERKIKRGKTMNQITENNVGLYKVAYEEGIQETADSDLTWDQRKFQANIYAASISPSVAKAIGLVMDWRRAADKTVVPPLSVAGYQLINGLMRWKTSIKWQYAKEKYETVSVETPVETPVKTPAEATKANGNTANGKSIRLDHGYISEWYEGWFQENDVLYARDKELASALGCSTGAFSFARHKMKEGGYEFECKNGVTKVTTRPIPEDRQQEIDKMDRYLAHLSNEIAQAQAQLETLRA